MESPKAPKSAASYFSSNALEDPKIQAYLSRTGAPKFIDALVQELIRHQPSDVPAFIMGFIDHCSRNDGKGGNARPLDGEFAPRRYVAGQDLFEAVPYYPEWRGAGEDGLTIENLKMFLSDPQNRALHVQPSLQSLIDSGSVTSLLTRSPLRDPSERSDHSNTMAALFQHCLMECRTQCQVLEAQCAERGKKFLDHSFWCGSKPTIHPKGAPLDCTVRAPGESLPVTDLFPDTPVFLEADGYGSVRGGRPIRGGNPIQGALGDAFLLDSLNILARSEVILKTGSFKSHPLARLVAFADPHWGIYGVCFYKNGAWEWVIVDGYIAIRSGAAGGQKKSRRGSENVEKRPLFCSPDPRTDPAIWPIIMEKAYAKLHSSFDSIDGGQLHEALEDLTAAFVHFGCPSISSPPSLPSPIATAAPTTPLPDLKTYEFATLEQLLHEPMNVVACEVDPYARDRRIPGRSGEQNVVYGLFKGHAYTVVEAHQCSDGQRFVYVQNHTHVPAGQYLLEEGDQDAGASPSPTKPPNEANGEEGANGVAAEPPTHAQGGQPSIVSVPPSGEWEGAYSAQSTEWVRNPHHREELRQILSDEKRREKGCFWMKWEDFRTFFTRYYLLSFPSPASMCLNFYGQSASHISFTPEHTFIVHLMERMESVLIGLAQTDFRTLPNHQDRKLLPDKAYSRIGFAVYRLTKLPESWQEVPHYVDCEIGAPPLPPPPPPPKPAEGEDEEAVAAAYQQQLKQHQQAAAASVWGTYRGVALIRRRQVLRQMDFEAGYYAIVPVFEDRAGMGFHLRIVLPPNQQQHMAVWRFADGPTRALPNDRAPIPLPARSIPTSSRTHAVPSSPSMTSPDSLASVSTEIIEANMAATAEAAAAASGEGASGSEAKRSRFSRFISPSVCRRMGYLGGWGEHPLGYQTALVDIVQRYHRAQDVKAQMASAQTLMSTVTTTSGTWTAPAGPGFGGEPDVTIASLASTAMVDEKATSGETDKDVRPVDQVGALACLWESVIHSEKVNETMDAHWNRIRNTEFVYPRMTLKEFGNLTGDILKCLCTDSV